MTGKKTLAKTEKTLIQWLIEKNNVDSYRAGTKHGNQHPEVDGQLLKILGGREKLISQAKAIENDAILGTSGQIRFDWCDLNTDIRKIHYSIAIIPKLCEKEGVEDPRQRQLRYIGIMKQWKERVEGTWLADYYREEIRKLEEGKISRTLQQNIEDGYLYRCLDEILHLKKPVEKPIFSARVFKNVKLKDITPSKIFREKYEGKVIHILKNSPDYVEDMEDDEVLAAHGILSYAQTLEWKGPLTYMMDTGDEIDSSRNVYGTMINAQTLEHAYPVSLSGVKRVFIIENKANYENRQFESNELSIFCHGFFSPKEVRFLKKITEVADEGTEYYHWGDMDYGGIRIFQFNKTNVFPKLIPYRMNEEEYEKAVALGAGVHIKEDKRVKLEKIEAGELEELKDCILKYGLEIEQEILVE